MLVNPIIHITQSIKVFCSSEKSEEYPSKTLDLPEFQTFLHISLLAIVLYVETDIKLSAIQLAKS